MKQLITFLFGQRAEGESLPQPSFKSTYPNDMPTINQWVKDFKFGSRYGHRGSFYTN